MRQRASLPPTSLARINTVSGSEEGAAVSMLCKSHQQLGSLLREHVRRVRADCEHSWTPAEFLYSNREQWVRLHRTLGHGRDASMAKAAYEMIEETMAFVLQEIGGRADEAPLCAGNVTDTRDALRSTTEGTTSFGRGGLGEELDAFVIREIRHLTGDAEVTGMASLGELGLDSVGYMELAMRLESMTSVRPSASMLQASATPHAIAEELRNLLDHNRLSRKGECSRAADIMSHEHADEDELVTLRATTSQANDACALPTVFCVHDFTGTYTGFEDVLTHLVHGKWVGLKLTSELMVQCVSVYDVVVRYMDVVERAMADAGGGIIRLVAHSMGAALAYPLAGRLEQRSGRHVMLAILDGPVPPVRDEPFTGLVPPKGLPSQTQLLRIGAALGPRGVRYAEYLLRVVWAADAFLKMAVDVFTGPLLFVLPSLPRHEESYARLRSMRPRHDDSLSVVRVNGDHDSFLRGESARDVADALMAFLALTPSGVARCGDGRGASSE